MSATLPISPAKTPSRPSPLRLLLANPLGAMGAYVLAAVFLLALAVPLLPLPDPNATDPAIRLQTVLASGHLLGTDALGRDMFSRLLWGSRTSLAVGLAAAAIAGTIGSAIGVIAGYAGRLVDGVLMRMIDVLMAFPYILLALAIVAALSPSLLNALYAIAIVNVPFFARNTRGIALALRRREFVDAARLSGKGPTRILVTEVLPNVLPVIAVTMSTTVGWMILETAGLSFLGLGAQPPDADLGSMLGEGRAVLFVAPHASIVPGLMIFVLVMSVNLVGDAIRDVLDPRMRSGVFGKSAAVTSVVQPGSVALSHSQAALDVRDLSVGFRLGGTTLPAVRGVTFALQRGECLGLMGESGAGKSVTALSVMRLLASPPGVITGGEVYLEGRNVLALKAADIIAERGGRVAYVFQDPLTTLHPMLTVGEQIAEAVRAHQPVGRAEALRRSVALLRSVEIREPEERVRSYPHQLSGGQRQRVGIAMALANDPEILIADEPTTALDVTVQARILELLEALREQRGLTLLLISHNFGVIARMCSRVAVMKDGEIVESGITSEVLAAPQHPYTRRLIACVPELGHGPAFLDDVRRLFNGVGP